jgi:predicted RNA-binding protein (virulence factor B family)
MPENREIAIGSFNELTVLRDTEFGLFLGTAGTGPDGPAVLLPNKYVPDGTRIGDTLRVFVYTDSSDRPVATTLTPRAVVGDITVLRVVSLGTPGAFLDWGLEKDLLVPFREQARPMVMGGSYVVRICFDELSRRVIATSRIDRFLKGPAKGLRPGQEVGALIYARTPLGFKAVLDGHNRGLLYHDQTSAPPRLGDFLTAYVQRIRPDGLVDLMLNPTAKQAASEGKPLILELLEKAGGFLPYNDGTPPEVISDVFGMSKKAFKQAIGNLFRARQISIDPDGIRRVGPTGKSGRP